MSVGWAPASKPARRTLPLVLLVLTFTTGIVDAVSYLGLGRVFTGLQTGNVVVLGFALAGTEGFSVAPPAASLASFFVGAWLGGRLAAHLGPRHRRWFSVALTIEALLVALAAAATAGLSPGVDSDRRLLVIALLATGMGLRSATVSRLGVPELTTTVVTSTITGLADPRVPAGSLTRRLWRLATIAVRLGGAVAGALLVHLTLFVPFLLVAGLIALAAAVYLAPVVVRAHRRSRMSTGPPASGA